VNKDVWNGVSDANKNAIRGCADLASYAGYWRAVQYTDFSLKGLADNGMKVQKAGEQLQADLNKIGETMSAEWMAAAGDEGKAIVEKFKSMQ
jgi:TRAP-type C4-dicarboxylate transport system substrate-binding protein